MAVVMLMEWPGVTRDDYDALREPVNWEGDPPEGIMFHVAAFDDNGIHVTDVWESQEHFQRFLEQRLMPEIQRQGRMQGQPNVRFMPVHATFAPAYAGARV